MLIPGDPEASELWQRIDSDEMPPKKPLSAAEKEILRDWIAQGAAWGPGPIDRFQFTSDTRAGYDWWSLAPLPQVAVPRMAAPRWAGNPIDAFVLRGFKSDHLPLRPRPIAAR